MVCCDGLRCVFIVRYMHIQTPFCFVNPILNINCPVSGTQLPLGLATKQPNELGCAP